MQPNERPSLKTWRRNKVSAADEDLLLLTLRLLLWTLLVSQVIIQECENCILFCSCIIRLGHVNAAWTNPGHITAYLEYSLVGRMLLQLNQTIENNQLHVVVALLDNQIDVALGSSLESSKARTPLKLHSPPLLGLVWGNFSVVQTV